MSYLPHIGQDSEPKTKPTQHAARTLNSASLQPDIIVARSTEEIDDKRKEKIAFNCGMKKEDVISAPSWKVFMKYLLILKKTIWAKLSVKN